LCFSIGNKIFCGTRIERLFRTDIKCDKRSFADLVERKRIVPIPRLSTTFWIRIEKGNSLITFEWNHCIKKSYNLVIAGLPKKIKQSITQANGR